MRDDTPENGGEEGCGGQDQLGCSRKADLAGEQDAAQEGEGEPEEGHGGEGDAEILGSR